MIELGELIGAVAGAALPLLAVVAVLVLGNLDWIRAAPGRRKG